MISTHPVLRRSCAPAAFRATVEAMSAAESTEDGTALLAEDAHFTVGDIVRVKAGKYRAGELGKVIVYDGSSVPYMIKFDAGDTHWYLAKEVEEVAPGFGTWQSKTQCGEWQEFPATLVRDLDRYYEFDFKCHQQNDFTFKLRHANAGLREGDPEELTYRIDFSAMTQVCVENPDRRRSIRRRDLDVRLTPIQQSAILNLEQHAYEKCGDEILKLRERTKRITGRATAFSELEAWLRHEAPIIIHVKLGEKADGRDQVDVYMNDADKQYKNMFEVGSGRGCTNQGVRKSWERRMFGDTYDKNVKDHERPKYGCLNVTSNPAGVENATQYGCSYLVLKNSVRWRCTLTSRDSDSARAEVATFRQFAKFLKDDHSWGADDSDLLKICKHQGENIKEYREVQIHGPVRFNHDVEKLCVVKSLHPSVKKKCEAWAARDGFKVEYVDGHDSRRGASSRREIDGGNM